MFEALIAHWAKENDVPILLPDEYEQSEIDFRESPCIDYGKFIRKSPWFVFRPLDQEQLSACLQYLSRQQIPFKIRGAGHSSGGQVLTNQGAVIDLRNVNRILSDNATLEQITVEGGCWWLRALQHLHPQQRRPLVLTDNSRTSVAGTLAVGGFGDTTHLYGLQIQSVVQVILMTLDGEKHVLNPSDELFRYTLAGRGQLGIIAEATIKTLSRPNSLCARLLKWRTLEEFTQDAIRIMKNRFYEFFRTKYYWQPNAQPHPIKAVAGNFVSDIPTSDPALEVLRPAKATPFEVLDLFQVAIHDPSENWQHCSPSLEIVLPLPDGLRTWNLMREGIYRSGLARFIKRGSSIMLFKTDAGNFPLAPFPKSEYCFLVAIRPAMKREEVDRFLPVLRRLGDMALQSGGKIYLMSIEIPRSDFLQLQFGDSLKELRRFKTEFDPLNLMNRGLL